jgi:hypothetical protein
MMPGRTRVIVRPDNVDGMVTKGYQKGVYERVTKEIMSLHPPLVAMLKAAFLRLGAGASKG